MSMSKKRKSAESNDDDEQTNEASYLFEPDAKRTKLIPLNIITLHDLPNELLGDVLVKAVVAEVKKLKLSKRVWKKKADLVINRLRTVCLRWSEILTTKFFRNKVHRILDATVKVTFRLEILHQSPIDSSVRGVAAMRDEVFVYWHPYGQASFINVHNRNDMAQVTDVIPIPGLFRNEMTACSVSNCVYVLHMESTRLSVLRAKRDEENRFRVLPWINDPSWSIPDLALSSPMTASIPHLTLSASINGSLVILSKQIAPKPSKVSVYNSDGSTHHAIDLFPEIHGFDQITDVVQKLDGNLVLAISGDRFYTDLKEIDTTGKIIRQYRSTTLEGGCVNLADFGFIIWISDTVDNVELLDSEFNLLNFTHSQMELGLFDDSYGIQCNSARNETLLLCDTANDIGSRALVIFRFTEE